MSQPFDARQSSNEKTSSGKTSSAQASRGLHRISIRDQLELEARYSYPALVQRLLQHKNRQPARQTQSQWQNRILLALCALLVTLFVIRTEIAIADGPQWGLQLKNGSSDEVQLAMDTSVQVDVTGLVARVALTQIFSNLSEQWAEGIYRFPLPQGAAVDRLHIKVGERILEGEIQQQQTARRIYQQARDNGTTATLVEQQHRNQFETRLANIGPGEAVEISIAYLQNISYSNGSYHLRIPLTFTPRWQSAQTPQNQPEPVLQPARATAGHNLQLHVNLHSPIELAVIESRYHDVDIRQLDHGYQVDLLGPYSLANRDFELSWSPTLRATPRASLTTFNDGKDVYAQLMLVPPLASAITAQAREVILIIDTSGSMAGASIRQARAALNRALEVLGPDDYFNLLQFNSDTRMLFRQSQPVTHTNLYAAQDFIDNLQANGGTNMQPALKQAFAATPVPDLMRQVVFITDGAVMNESDLLQQVAEQLGNSRLFTVAIGPAPNSWFMRKAAEIGRGSFVHIGKLAEVETRMSALWERIDLPALTDICVNWGEAAEFYPEVIPDLYAGEPLWLIARLPGEPTMIGVCGNFNGQDWQLNVNGYEINNRNPGGPGGFALGTATGTTGGENLPVLWARKKIEALEDGLMFGADRKLTDLEITRLALDYGLLTRHTSLVAVDKSPRRANAEALGQNIIPGLLPAGTTAQLAGYPATATGWLSQLLLSLLVLLLSSALLWFSGNRLPMVDHSANSSS